MNNRRGMTLVAMLALVVLQPAMGEALGVGDNEPVVAVRNGVADELEARAEELLARRPRSRAAARLLEEAAEAREVMDPKRYSNTLLAGWVYYHAGDGVRGQQLIERAADQALATGLLWDAAHTYIQAAFISMELKRPGQAQALALKAEMLSSSPFLSEEERASILNRLGRS
jgi:hypothetical protein